MGNQYYKNVPHLRLLMIGRSGAGKTTLINFFANLFHDKSYDSERLISITQCFEFRDLKGEPIKIRLESNLKDQNSQDCSHPQKCKIYTFEKDDLVLSLIDTPGLGDTCGIKQDKESMAHILNGIQQVTAFNAICLVHKGSDAMADNKFRYLINEIKGMLTKECRNCFILCFTSVTNKFKIEAIPALKSMGVPTDRTVYFENDCLIPPNKLPTPDDSAKAFWTSNKKNYEQVIEFARFMIPKKTNEINDLSSNKSILTQLVQEVALNVELVKIEKKYIESNTMKLQSLLKEIEINKESPTMSYYISTMKLHIEMQQTDLKKRKIVIHRSYREIVHIYMKIQEKSLQPANEYFLDYLDDRESALRLNNDISNAEVQTMFQEIEHSRQEYLLMNDVVAKAISSSQNLTRNEIEELEIRMRTIGHE